jgi:hypothetical protein
MSHDAAGARVTACRVADACYADDADDWNSTGS